MTRARSHARASTRIETNPYLWVRLPKLIDVSVVDLDCWPSTASPFSLIAAIKNEVRGKTGASLKMKWGQESRC